MRSYFVCFFSRESILSNFHALNFVFISQRINVLDKLSSFAKLVLHHKYVTPFWKVPSFPLLLSVSFTKPCQAFISCSILNTLSTRAVGSSCVVQVLLLCCGRPKTTVTQIREIALKSESTVHVRCAEKKTVTW